jgi:serine/threonine protein kinase
MADRVGEQWGNYRLVHHLAHGGYAEVYLGEHIYVKSQAALKLLFSSTDEENVEQFRAEAKILVGLRHPHIVRMLDFTVEREIPVLIMDYAPGGSVRKRHTESSSLPLVTVVGYVKQVAAALQYAHNHGIIHRDVKPENILFDADQQILLSDFGIALLAPSPELLGTRARAGTRAYKPPEQWDGQPTFASDQYALGITTYEWLCGERPFRGDPWALEYQHKKEDPPSLRQRCPGLPAAVEEVVFTALKKDPKQRFANIRAFANALEQVSQGSVQVSLPPIPIRVPSSDEHTLVDSPALPQARRRVFLTATPADTTFSARLQADLQARGISVVSDPMPKADQQETLQQAIRDVDLVLVVVSPSTRSSRTVKEPLRIATIYQRRLVFVQITDDEPAAVFPETWGRTALIEQVDAREPHYQAALDEIMAFLKEDVSTSKETTLAVPASEPHNPYKGLESFKEGDADYFFGRDTLIAKLVGTLEEILTEEKPVPTSRLLTVVGPSGSGKSSVVLAGLLPALKKGIIPGSESWVYLEPIIPGQSPLKSLADVFAPRMPPNSLPTHEMLEDDATRGLHLLATQMDKQPGAKVVLIIDQFEELFTQTVSESERQRFIDLLVTAVTQLQGPLIVLLTLRADFYDRPMQYRQLIQLIEAHRIPVLPMGPHELRAVIEQPALLPDAHLIFEGNLVGDLLFEMQGQPGALPLLEFTLDELFHRRNGYVLTLEAYREIGGLKGALTRHAESTYASLPSPEHQRLARALFLRLIDPGLSEQDTTRRRADLLEFKLPDETQKENLQAVAKAFVNARLLTTNEIAGPDLAPSKLATIEVSHEALIREWPRLIGWLREGREDIKLQQTLSRNVAEWEERGKPNAWLYRGSQLKETQAWARRNIPNGNEIAFLRASAIQRTRMLLSIIVVVFVLLSTTGVAVWFLTRPDPTHVTNLNDHGMGSLRYAIDDSPSGSTITFDPSLQGTIQLTSGNLNFGKNLTVLGPGADKLVISSTRSYVIHVIPGVSVSISNISFKDSQITFEDTGSLFFSFINNEGTLSLTNSIISGNKVSSSGSFTCGGGIYNGGKLSLGNTLVTHNRVFGSKSISGDSSLTLCGGGIFNDTPATLTLTNSTVSENIASGGTTKFICGGGIYSSGTLVLTNSTVSENSASAGGSGSDCSGGIYNDVGTLTLTNSTISDNTTVYAGGGIVNRGGRMTLTFCTIYGNRAQKAGGITTVDISKNSGSTSVRSSILAGNIAPDVPDVSGKLTSLGYNVIGNPAGATLLGSPTVLATDVVGVSSSALKIDPLLRDNGGLTKPHTWTHALLPGSPAIDLIPSTVCVSFKVPNDQRGVKRPHGKGCDSGAYERA